MLPFLIRAIELVPEVKAHLSDKALEVLKSIETYDRQLWSYALELYRTGDGGAFLDKFITAIASQLTRAWGEGAREVGVDPKDMTDDDRAELKAIIDGEYDQIIKLAEAIMESRSGTLDEFRQKFRSRIDLWVNRYTDVIGRARVYFGGKTRLKWTLGKTEEHCETCATLNGVVAFATEWEQSGIKPQSPPNSMLACSGWNCDCSLDVTDQRRSPNALETLMNIAAARNIDKSMKGGGGSGNFGHAGRPGLVGGSADRDSISQYIDSNKTGEPITDQLVYRYGNADSAVVFYSRDRDYSEEYAIVRGGSPKDIKEMIISINNPLVINAPPNKFSDPDFENPIIKQAKLDGYDGIVFIDKEDDLEFYVVFQ